MFPLRGRKLSTTIAAILTSLLAGLVLLPTARAQNENETTGFSSTHVFDGGYFGENIDTLNGNLNLTMPIGPSYQVNKNLSYQLKLIYNSRVWDFADNRGWASRSSLVGESPFGLGFTLSFGRIYRDYVVHFEGGLEERWYFVTPDGNKHDLGDKDDPITSNDSTYFSPTKDTDGAGNTIYRITNGTGIRYTLSHHVVVPGTKCTLCDWHDANAAFGGWYVTLIEDTTTGSEVGGRYPNWVEIQYETPSGPSPEESPEGYGQCNLHVLDSLGRSVDFENESVATGTPGHPGDPRSRRTKAIHLPKFDVTHVTPGVKATYSFDHDRPMMGVPILNYDTSPPSYDTKRSALRLRSLGLPGGYQIQFGYASITGSGSEMTLRTLPMNQGGVLSGARMEYEYQDYKYLRKHIQNAGTSAAGKEINGSATSVSGVTLQIKQKRLYLGNSPAVQQATWDYDRLSSTSVTNPEKVTVTITQSDPTKFNETVYYFHASPTGHEASCYRVADGCAPEWNDGLGYWTEYWEGRANMGRLLRTEETIYTPDVFDNGDLSKNNIRTVRTITTHVDDGGKQQISENSFWDVLTHHWKVTAESAFGLPGARLTHTEYAQHGTRLDTYDYQEISDGTTVISRSDYAYDGGRLVTERKRKTVPATLNGPMSVTPDPGDVVTSYAYNGEGNVDRKTLSSPGTTTYTIQYLYNLPGGNGPYLQTKQFIGMNWKSIDWKRDANTGLIYQSCDTAGVCTNYNYDDLGRITQILPTWPEYATAIKYTSLKETEVWQSAQSGADPTTACTSAADCIHTKFLYDDLARLVESQKRNAIGGTVHQVTQYDALSNVAFRSEWADLGVDSPPGTSYDYSDPMSSADPALRQQDPFGRAFLVTTADGMKTRTSYRGQDTTVTVEGISGKDGHALNSTTTYTKDGMGRLREVSYPSTVDSVTGEVLTVTAAKAVYTYDGQDNLTQVELISPDSSRHQFRTFAYDALGRLLREDNPENGTTTYDGYDALGNLLGKRDNAGNTFTLAYDGAGRLRQASKGGTVIAANTYDQPTTGGDTFGYSQGKLTTVESFSEVGISEVTQKYYYSGLNGRPSGDTTRFPEIANDYRTWVQYGNYGLPTTLSYPQDGTERPVHNMAYTYTNGFLRTVTDQYDGTNTPVLKNVVYNSTGGIYQIQTQGDVWDLVTPDSRNRPNRIQVQKIDPNGVNPTVTYWETGEYKYDGAGNIKEIGATGGSRLTFGYDGVNRLVRAQIDKDPNHPTEAAKVYYQDDYDLEFGYDPFGNLLTRDERLTGYHRKFAVDYLTNRLQSVTNCTYLVGGACTGTEPVAPVAYDTNGSVVQDEGHTFQMDAMNRVLKVRDRSSGSDMDSFRYDAAGRRVVKRSENSGLTTFYVRDREGQVLSEFSRPTSSTVLPLWKGDYVYAAGRVVAMTERNKPDPPAGLFVETVTGCSPPEVKLVWSRSPESDVTGYEVYRDGTRIADNVPVSDAFYVDHPTGGITYNYQLKAKDPLTSSDLSPAYRANFCHPVSPNSPGSLGAAPGDGRISLGWNVATTTGPNAVIGYEIHRTTAPGGVCPSPGSAYSRLSSWPVVGTAYVDVPVTNGTAYCYYVVARDTAAQFSAASEVKLATPVDRDAPAPPRNLRVHTGCPGSPVSVQWDPNTEPDLQEYRLYRSAYPDMRDATVPVQTLPATVSFPVADDPLAGADPQGQTFYYVVEVYDTSNNWSRSPILVARLRDSSLTAPTSLVASAGTSRVTLDWNHSTDRHFKVYRKPLGGTSADFQVILNETLLGPSTFSATDYLVLNFSAYEYAVAALEGAGTLERESCDSPTAGPAVPMEPVGGVQTCYLPKFPARPYPFNTLGFTWPQLSMADRLYDPLEASRQGRGYVGFVGHTLYRPEDVIRYTEMSSGGPSGAAFTVWNNKIMEDAADGWRTLQLRAVYRINDFKYCSSLVSSVVLPTCTGRMPDSLNCAGDATHDPCACFAYDVCWYLGEHKIDPSVAYWLNPADHPGFMFSEPFPLTVPSLTITQVRIDDGTYPLCSSRWPAKPVNVKGSVGAMPGEIKLEWSPPAGSAQVAGYEIFTRFSRKPILLPPSVTSFTATGINACDGASFLVESHNAMRVDSLDDVSLLYPKVVAPQASPPGNIQLAPGPGNGQLTLSWQRPGATGCQMTHVEITRTDSNGGTRTFTPIASLAGPVPARESWTDPDTLTLGVDYSYKLRGSLTYSTYNSDGQWVTVETYSGDSAPVTARPLGSGGGGDIATLAAPTSVTLTNPLVDRVTVGWTAPAAVPDGYRLYIWTEQSAHPGLWNPDELIPFTRTSQTVTGLEAGRTYTLAVTSANWQNPSQHRDVNGVPLYVESPHSLPAVVTLPTPPTGVVAPTGVSAQFGSAEGEIVLSWDRSPDPATGYYVEETTDPTAPRRLTLVDPTSGQIVKCLSTVSPRINLTLSNLARRMQHRFVVISTNQCPDADGNGGQESAPSVEASAYAYDQLPPDVWPKCTYCSGTGPTTITVMWYPVSTLLGHHYFMQRTANAVTGCGETPKYFPPIPLGQTSLQDTSLVADCTYTYALWAVDVDGSLSLHPALAMAKLDTSCYSSCYVKPPGEGGAATGNPCTMNCQPGPITHPRISWNRESDFADEQLCQGELMPEDTGATPIALDAGNRATMEPYRVVGVNPCQLEGNCGGGGGGGNYTPPSFQWRFFHADHLGTPRIITDANGSIVSEHHYLPFGEEVPPSTHNGVVNASNNSHRFTGHERDSETGLDYMLARYYEAGLGRFLSPDPLLSSANPSLAQSWNRYSYAWNNPVLLFDPTGEVVQLTGKTEEERKQELEAIKHALHDDEAASQLGIDEVTGEDGSTSYQVVIQGDAQAFGDSSPTAALVGDAISSSKTVEFGFGAKSETVATGNGNSRITVNPGDASKTVGGVTQSLDTVVQHEFGHGMGIATGAFKGREIGTVPLSQLGTNPEALAAENTARAWYVQKAAQTYGQGSVAAKAAQRVYGKPRETH